MSELSEPVKTQPQCVMEIAGNRTDAYYVPKLINEVQKRSILWNRYHENYHNRYLVERGWQEVASIMERDKDNIRQRWKHIKDTFKRELRKIKKINEELVYTGRWRYFDQASFLKETFVDVNEVTKMLNKESKNTQEAVKLDEGTSPYNLFDYQFIKEEDETSSEVIAEAIDVGNGNREEPSSSKTEHKRRSSEVSLDDIEVKKPRTLATEQSAELNDDYHFALSLVPFLKELDILKKLKVRNEIQTILHNALMSSENMSTIDD